MVEQQQKDEGVKYRSIGMAKGKQTVQDFKSKKTWASLNVPEVMIKNGLNELKFISPSKVQSLAIPSIMAEPPQNFMFQSQNGSGKTGAFGIPAIMKVDPTNENFQVIIFGHTRELIFQTMAVLKIISKGMNVSINAGEGGSVPKCQILITTPMWFSQKLGNPRLPLNLKDVKLIIYDEADEIIKMEQDESKANQNFTTLNYLINTELKQKQNVNPQQVFISATFEQSFENLVEQLSPELEIFTLSTEELKLIGIKQFYISLTNEIQNLDNAEQEGLVLKVNFLKIFYSQMPCYSGAMVFVNKVKTAQVVKQMLEKEGISVQILSSGVTDQERDRIIQSFRELQFNVLIATNVLARGIDIPQVDIVINFDVPIVQIMGWKEPDYPNYLHRIGRTGRFGTDGCALTFTFNETEDTMIQTKIPEKYKSEIREIKDLGLFFDEFKKMRPYLTMETKD